MRKLLLVVFIILGSSRLQAQTTTDSLLSTPKKDLTTFVKIINAAGIKNLFSGQPMTIFAPDNGAFDKFSVNKIDSLLMPVNKSKLLNTLKRHIVAGKLTAKDIAKAIRDGGGNATFKTLAGTRLNAKINTNRNIVLSDETGCESIIKVFNINEGSADLFVIDSVLLPKNRSLQFTSQ